jgi:hypothetical protein
MLYGTTRKGRPFTSAKIIEVYLLRVLFEALGCYLRSYEAMDRIYSLLNGKLTEADYEDVGDGVQRWKNNVLWARLQLANEGLIKPFGDSPRGWWELTEAGMEEAYRVWAEDEAA